MVVFQDPASLVFFWPQDARFQLYGHGGEAAADQPRRRAAMGGAVGGGRFEEILQGNDPDPHIPTTNKGEGKFGNSIDKQTCAGLVKGYVMWSSQEGSLNGKI